MTNISPQDLHLERAPDGTLRAQLLHNRCGLAVDVLRAFPLSHPYQYIVLRDGGGAELGVIEDLQALEPGDRSLLEGALEGRYFLPRITRILAINERFGSATWEVETDKGAATINTKALHEAITEITHNRFMITDVEENRFEIPDVAEMDIQSQQRFMGKF